jgi:hypothetical protein
MVVFRNAERYNRTAFRFVLYLHERKIAMSIVSRAELIVALGKGPSLLTDQDLGLLNLVQAPTESLIEAFLGFRVQQQTLTEYYPDRNYVLQVDPLVEG